MGRFLAIFGFLLCFGQSLVWATTENVYFVVNKTLELRPPPNMTINIIVWRDSKGLVAEWRKGDATVAIYQDYKDRATMNTATGYLEIKNMTQKDAVQFTVEINDVLLDNKYVATAIEEVPKPSVWARPDGDNLKLTCDGDVDKAGPVTYRWNLKEDAEWVELKKIVTIQKNETTQKLKTFSCKMKNLVGEKESDPDDNPWFKPPEQETGNAGAIAALVLFLLLVVGCAIAAFIKRDAIKAKCGTCLGSNDAAENDSAVSPKNETEVALNPKEGTAG